MRTLNTALLIALGFASSHVLANTSASTAPGVLDRPLPESPTSLTEVVVQPAAVLNADTPDEVEEVLTEEFIEEQEELEQLPRVELQDRADLGERGAQVVLAEDFAQEAAMLAFAPAAANEALSDAVRWYSLAAQRGYPGAPSLEQAGVQFFPIRAQRDRSGS